MADASHQNGRGPWFEKLLPHIITASLVGAITWGSTQADIKHQDAQINDLKRELNESRKSDTMVAERLARIEANLQFVVEETRRQQQLRR
ncbi:hypothetical protein [Ferrovibrio terrae]|uniref:hypothetical protein n=1 Tax=Ferrovibrio terrae TaxID=2594003 RepID=UPI0031383459